LLGNLGGEIGPTLAIGVNAVTQAPSGKLARIEIRAHDDVAGTLKFRPPSDTRRSRSPLDTGSLVKPVPHLSHLIFCDSIRIVLKSVIAVRPPGPVRAKLRRQPYCFQASADQGADIDTIVILAGWEAGELTK
jgi:hypothetical protein